MARNRRRAARAPRAPRALFFAGLVVFALALQFSTANLGSIDGYFHIRYAAILGAAGWRSFPPLFPWLPLTILNPDDYYDHHFLFHVGLVPFARGDLILGAKLAAGLGAALAFTATYSFLLWRGVRHAEWWMVAILAAAPGFLYRMEMPRVQSWSFVFLVGALALLVARRPVWLLPLGFAYTWLYDAFPFLLALAAAAVLAHRLKEGDLDVRPFAHASLGVSLGLVVNPYFPENLRFIVHHYAVKLAPGHPIAVGAEWNPLPVLDWFGWGGLLAVLAGCAALLRAHRARLDAAQLTAVFAALFFLALLWRSSRFLEYFVPFAGIALAMVLHAPVADLAGRLEGPRRRLFAAALAAWLAVASGLAVRQLRGRPDAGRYGEVARWIRDNTPAGSLVFNASWDAFPQLFFHAPANAYVIGLDPTYLALQSQDLYDDWERVGAGREKAPAWLIRERFGAEVAVVDRGQSACLAALDGDRRARRVHADGEAVVYRVSDR